MVNTTAARPLSSGFATEGLREVVFVPQARLELWAYTSEIWAGGGERRKLSCSCKRSIPLQSDMQRTLRQHLFALMISLSEKYFQGLFF